MYTFYRHNFLFYYYYFFYAWSLFNQEASLGGNKPTGKKFISAEQADELKMKEKRKREREVIPLPSD